MTSRAARRLLALAAPALLAAGCTYSYDNPAQDLGTAEVVGRVIPTAGSTTGLPGVQVAVKNSVNSTVTRDTGRYFLFGMMPGRHTVLFSQPPDLALQRDVEMVWGSDGQPEGVVLGDLVMRRAVRLTGRITLPTNLGTGGNFLQVEQVAVLDEATGQQSVTIFPPAPTAGVPAPQPADWTFDYALSGAPIGPHRLTYALAGQTYACGLLAAGVADPTTCTWYGGATFLAGPVLLDLPESSEGLQLALTDVQPVFPTPGVLGKLRFQAAVAGASYAGAFDVQVTLQPSGTQVAVSPPDSTGTYELDVVPGPYTVAVRIPAGAATSLVDPPPGQVVVVESQTSELGTFYAVDASVLAQSSSACFEPADCSTGNCQDGSCAAAACMVAIGAECANAWTLCISAPVPTPCNGGKGYCAGRSSVDTACVPSGATSCTDAAGTDVIPACRPN